MKQPRQQLRHIIGRVFTSLQQLFLTRKTIDATIPDYEWWDKFRHALIPGYEIAGVLSNSINEIVTAWVLGRGVDIELTPVEDARMQAKVKYTNDSINRLMTVLQAQMQQWHDDYMGLGDLFLFVNPDGTIDNIPPNTVTMLTDPLNPALVTGYEITTITDEATIVDTFTATERIKRIAKYSGSLPNNLASIINSTNNFGVVNIPNMKLNFTIVERYTNFIGRLPVVHFSQGIGSNELRGHPFVRDIRTIMSEFDDLAVKSMQGAKVSGNPMPVFEGLKDPKETIDLNTTASDETYVDKDGNDETRKTIKWDELPALFLGEGGRFTFASPPVGFSTDTIGMLKFFRSIMRDALHTPGSVFGGDDSIDPNMKDRIPAWVKIVEGMRDKFAGRAYDDKLDIEAKGGLYELIHVWLLTKRLSDPKILIAPVTIQWPDLTEDDFKTKFEAIKWAQSRNGLRVSTSVRLLNLVENPEKEYELAQEEAAAAVPVMPTTDFGGVGNPAKNPPPVTQDNTPDLRAGNGADAPRMPAYGGGNKSGK